MTAARANKPKLEGVFYALDSFRSAKTGKAHTVIHLLGAILVSDIKDDRVNADVEQ